MVCQGHRVCLMPGIGGLPTTKLCNGPRDVEKTPRSNELVNPVLYIRMYMDSTARHLLAVKLVGG
eukprot:COSAG02_NODE_374_length_23583_cov_12.568855_3_plen_65_part_00